MTLMEPAPELDQVQQDASLSQVTEVVVTNYTKYHVVASRLHGLQLWVETQRQLHEKEQ